MTTTLKQIKAKYIKAKNKQACKKFSIGEVVTYNNNKYVIKSVLNGLLYAQNHYGDIFILNSCEVSK